MKKRRFTAPDGATWDVDVRAPGASNVMIVFHHANASTARETRYAWHVWPGAEARDVTARLKPKDVLAALTEDDLARLFRRSMRVSSAVPDPAPAYGGSPGDL